MSFQLPDWFKYEMRRKRERLGIWWEELAVRKWLNDNPKLAMTIAPVCVGILVVVAVWSLWPESAPPVVEYEKEWFYDLNTGVLFPVKKGLTPPVEAPSGPAPDGTAAGVRAYVLTYVDEPNEAERFIAFLEIADPNASDELSEPTGRYRGGAGRWARGKLIRRIEDRQWVPASSPPGRAIFEKAFAPDENGEQPHSWLPE